jgi:hypothetical protein
MKLDDKMYSKKKTIKKMLLKKYQTNKLLKGGSSSGDNGRPKQKKQKSHSSSEGYVRSSANELANNPELSHKDDGPIRNKKTNASTVIIYKYTNDNHIVLIGEKHSVVPESDNIFDIIKLLQVAKYKKPPTIYLEYATDIPSDVPKFNSAKQKMTGVGRSSMLHIHLTKPKINSHITMLRNGVFDTEGVNVRSELMIGFVIHKHVEKLFHEKKKSYEMIYNLINAVVSFSEEKCNEFESKYYEAELADSFMRASYYNEYINEEQKKIKKGKSIHSEYNITSTTPEIKYIKLASFVKRINEVVPARTKDTITKFFTSENFKKLYTRKLDTYFEGRVHVNRGFFQLILSCLVEIYTICLLERDMVLRKNILVCLGNAHILMIHEYLDFRKSEMKNIELILEHDNQNGEHPITTYEILKELLTSTQIQSLLEHNFLTHES